MTTTFLDKFRSGLKAVQGQQILKLISKEKDRGSITTVDEFKARLLELTSLLSGTTISPTLKLYLGKSGDIIDSESFNFMMQQIENDLSAAFSEANSIDEILSSHEEIINDVVLKTLELSINDLESKIESLEFLNNISSGFDNVFFNTFRVTQNSRSAFNEGVAFIDPKTLTSSSPSNEANIDFIGEKLLSKTQDLKPVNIASIRQIFDSESPASELNVETDNNSLTNILDRTAGTFWSQSILLSKPKGETGVLTKLELNLGSIQTINFIQIEPFSKVGLDLYRIYFIDSNGQIEDILINPVTISTTNKFFFRQVSTSKLVVVIRNRNFIETQFEIKPEGPLIEQTIENIQEDLKDILSSPRTKKVLGLDSNPKKKYRKYYEYQIGIDNIEVGLSQFEETSIFLSKSEKVVGCQQVALKVLDKRAIGSSGEIEYTTDTQPIDFEDMFHTSLEYYLIKRDFKEDETLINSYTIPLLPIHNSVVRHERLVLSNKSDNSLNINDVGYLQFYTNETIEDFFVYRNGISLVPTDLSIINPTETDGWLINEDLSERSSGQLTRMRIAIQIQNPSITDIFTVSYTPKIGDTVVIPQEGTVANVVDLTGKLYSWIGRNNIVYFSNNKKESKIAYSLLNFVTVLRRNTSNATLTSVLEEYTFISGTKNPSKFGD